MAIWLTAVFPAILLKILNSSWEVNLLTPEDIGFVSSISDRDD